MERNSLIDFTGSSVLSTNEELPDDAHYSHSGLKINSTFGIPSQSSRVNTSHTDMQQDKQGPPNDDATIRPRRTFLVSACRRCGMQGHKSRDCNRFQTCYRCGKAGHVMTDCETGRQSGGCLKMETGRIQQPVVPDSDLIDLTSDDDTLKNGKIVSDGPEIGSLFHNRRVQQLFGDTQSLKEPTLLDQEIEEPLIKGGKATGDRAEVNDESANDVGDGQIGVTLTRMRKGKKGRGAIYDFTPYLFY